MWMRKIIRLGFDVWMDEALNECEGWIWWMSGWMNGTMNAWMGLWMSAKDDRVDVCSATTNPSCEQNRAWPLIAAGASFFGAARQSLQISTPWNVLGLDAEETAANGPGRFAQKEKRSQQNRLPSESEVRAEFPGCTKARNQLCEAVAQDLQAGCETQGRSQ